MLQIVNRILNLPFIVARADRHYSLLYDNSPAKESLPKFKGLPSRMLLEVWMSTDPNNLEHARKQDLIAPFTAVYAWVSAHDDWADDPDGAFRSQTVSFVQDGLVNRDALHHVTRNAEFKSKTLNSVNTRLIETTCAAVDDFHKARVILSEASRLRNDFFQTTAEIDIAGNKPTLQEILSLRTGLAFRAAFLAISILEASKPEPNTEVINQISHWAAAMQVADDLIDFYDDTKDKQTTLMTGALEYFEEWPRVREWMKKFSVLPRLMLKRFAPMTNNFIGEAFKNELGQVNQKSILPFKTLAKIYYHGASIISPLRKFFRSKYQL